MGTYKISQNSQKKEVTARPSEKAQSEIDKAFLDQIQATTEKVAGIDNLLNILKRDLQEDIKLISASALEHYASVISKIEELNKNTTEDPQDFHNSIEEIRKSIDIVNEFEETIDTKFEYYIKHIIELQRTRLTAEEVKAIVKEECKANEVFKRFNTIEARLNDFDSKISDINSKCNDIENNFNKISNKLLQKLEEIDEKINTNPELNKQLSAIEDSLKSISDFKFQFQKIGEISQTTSILSSNMSLVENRVKSFEGRVSVLKDSIDNLNREVTQSFDANIRNSNQTQQKINSNILSAITAMSDSIIKAIQMIDRKGDIDVVNNQLRQLSQTIAQTWNKKLEEIKSTSQISENRIDEIIDNLLLEIRNIQVKLESMDPVNTEKAKLEIGTRVNAALNEFHKKVDQTLNSHLSVFEKKVKKSEK